MAIFQDVGAATGSLLNTFNGLANYLANKPYIEQGRKAIEDAYLRMQGFSPEQIQAIHADPQAQTELSKIHEDPTLRNYQMDALSGLGTIVDAGGAPTAQDYEAYQRARQQAGQQAAAARGAAAHEQQARGMQGGNAALLQNLNASQNANNQGNAMAVQAASDSRERYLQALNALGSQAANVRGQDYGIKSNAANAQDSINRFNAQMRVDAQKFNKGLEQQNLNNRANALQMRMQAAQALAGGNANFANWDSDKAARIAAMGAKTLEQGGAVADDFMSMFGGGGGTGGAGFGGGGGGFGF